MMNKDYILRMVEKFGRALAVILHLREINQREEALIYIDDSLLQTVGLTSSFINSISEEMLLQILSPLGALNVDKCLWIAAMLKVEGDIYEEMGQANEGYYRYLKSLHLFLEVQLRENVVSGADFSEEIGDLLRKLEEYKLPNSTKSKLFSYYEHIGRYGKDIP